MNCLVSSERIEQAILLQDAAAVAIVGDTALFREGLRHIFAGSPFDVVATADRLDGIEPAASGAGVLVILLAIDPERQEEFDRIAEARMLHPDAAIVCLCTECGEDQVLPMLEAGVAAILLRTVAADTLIQSLELALLGQRVVPHLAIPAPREAAPGALPVAEPAPCERRDGREAFRPSAREMKIIACLVKGESNRVIADRLSIAEGRVKGHVKAILRKIQVKNRTQAAIWGMRHLVGTELVGGMRFDPAVDAPAEDLDEADLPVASQPVWRAERSHAR
jgi:two-component system, NarL family, nitrate/nitrite response regulator NarL